MAYDRFLIAPIKTGLQNDLRPWITPEDSLQRSNNAYVFRGRIRKRFGSSYTGSPSVANNSRLGGIITNIVNTTDGAGNYGPLVAVPTALGNIGSKFVVGSAEYTVYQASGAMKATQGSGTFDTTTSVLQLIGAPVNTAIYYYPALPVMGLGIYELGSINNQPAFAFDTRWPYKFNGSSWDRQNSSASSAPIFTGTNNDYFWITNWRGILDDDVTLFVSNYVDEIYLWDGSDWDILAPPSFNTQFNSNGDFVYTARIVLPFQGHLVVLNTIEENGSTGAHNTYANRARWSAYGSPFADGAWLIPEESYTIPGPVTLNAFGGNFADAATTEAIIGAEFIKDRLIVYFEQSTWELAYSANNVLPFTWQKINTELGAVGTFSTVPFDKAVLGVGKTGVHACSGANVERIDQKIPDEVFTFKVAGNAYRRIWGIRVYQPELVVWSFVAANAPSTTNFANKQLIYNYENQTWSINDDCVMCYGYFEQQSDMTWSSCPNTWETADYAWNSWVQPAELRQVIFGNQQGFVCILQPDEPRNVGNMQISNMTNVGDTWTITSINHNLAQGDFVLIENASGITITNDGIFKVISAPPVSTANTFTIDGTGVLSGNYAGKGTLARVSRVDVISKQWNPYITSGLGVYLAKILFAVQTTPAGTIQVDYNSDDSDDNFVEDSGPNGTGAIMGTSVLDLYPYPGFDTEGANRLWHPVYFQGQGNCVQIRMYYNNQQMVSKAASLEEFEVQAIMLLTMKGSLIFG